MLQLSRALEDAHFQFRVRMLQLLAHPALVWVETPANPLWTVTDIAATAEIAHAAGALLAVDSTPACSLRPSRRDPTIISGTADCPQRSSRPGVAASWPCGRR